jgi:molecular chaperone HtpG
MACFLKKNFLKKLKHLRFIPSVDGTYYTYEELYNKIKANQTDKDDKLVILYAANKDEQHSYIEAAQSKRV